MSSATEWNVGEAARQVLDAAAGRGTGGEVTPAASWQTERQQRLALLWAIFRGEQYDIRPYDWHGRDNLGMVERTAILQQGRIPEGWSDAGGGMVPLDARAPAAPTHLPRVIVTRFTSLLFSAKRNPRVVADDDATTDWLAGFCERTRLWSLLAKARNKGGAVGSVGLSFRFDSGRPVVEVHDARFTTPTFADRVTGDVSALDICYQYAAPTPEGMKLFWYRRLITNRSDTVWEPVPVDPEGPPSWDALPCKQVAHGLGECPAVWVQNLDNDESIDGDPDCAGAFSLAERVDVLWSQADRGTVANCDPSVVISTDAELDGLNKGSGNALQVERGGSAQYMEMTGGGVSTAMTLAEKLEERVLLLTRCVLETRNRVAQRTATEVEQEHGSMLEQADLLREAYGERGVKPLLEKVLRAARRLSTPQKVGAAIVRQAITLPRKRTVDDKGRTVWAQRVLGNGTQVEVEWPSYFAPSPTRTKDAVDAATRALNGNLVDLDTAAKHVLPLFGVENVADVLQLLHAERERRQSDEDPGGRALEDEPDLDEDLDPLEVQVNKIDLAATDLGAIITVNEARKAHGLTPLAQDGELTVAQYKAKYRKLLQLAAEADAPEGGEAAPPLDPVVEGAPEEDAPADDEDLDAIMSDLGEGL